MLLCFLTIKTFITARIVYRSHFSRDAVLLHSPHRCCKSYTKWIFALSATEALNIGNRLPLLREEDLENYDDLHRSRVSGPLEKRHLSTLFTLHNVLVKGALEQRDAHISPSGESYSVFHSTYSFLGMSNHMDWHAGILKQDYCDAFTNQQIQNWLKSGCVMMLTWNATTKKKNLSLVVPAFIHI